MRVFLLMAGVAGILAANWIVMPQRYALHVQTETARPQSLPLIIKSIGSLEAKASVTLRVPFDGPLSQKKYKEGDRVTTGQVLLTVNREKIRLDYQNKKDALQNAQSDLTRAQKELRLQKTLFQKQAVAYSAVEEAQRSLVRAEQALRAAQETFRSMQGIWNADAVKAPFTGTIVKDFLGEETQIGANKDLLVLADVSEYTTRIRIDEMDIKRVEEGQPATVRIAMYPKNTFQATVSQIGTATESSGATLLEIPVTLRLKDSQGLMLRPKLTTEARVFTGETEPVISVPRDAIDNRTAKPRIWRVDRWKRLRAVSVTTGRSNPERVEVSGLLPGWQICIRTDPQFREGLRVVQ